jgi:hypothetical protein
MPKTGARVGRVDGFSIYSKKEEKEDMFRLGDDCADRPPELG